MNKRLTAIALAASSLAAQEAFATIANTLITNGTQIQVGCTAPTASGSTVYSLDIQANNAAAQQDSVALPSGVSVGASCTYSLNQLAYATIGTGGTGRWVGAGTKTATDTVPVGLNPVLLTVPNGSYSLTTYSLIAQ